ncbi:MAG: ISAs1 family transposase [Chlamydiae bacterium]|nr:ISAs1 family transposase [Chlamydiota bacterium]
MKKSFGVHLHWTVRKQNGKESKSYSLARSYRTDEGKVRKEILHPLGTLTMEEVDKWRFILQAAKNLDKNQPKEHTFSSTKEGWKVFVASVKKKFDYDQKDEETDWILMQEAMKTAFSELHDPRSSDNLDYPFYGVLLMILAATLASAKSIASIHEYAQTKKHIFGPLLGIDKMPGYMAFWWILTRSNPFLLNQAFMRWIKSIADALNVEPERDIAVDGKTLRGAKDRAVHYVSAYDNTRGLLLGQTKTREKSNEITAIPELLKVIDITGAIVTIDAMGCQKGICALIRSLEGDYCIALKKNQEVLYEEAQNFFIQAREVCYDEVPCTRDISENKGHGRLERREVSVTTDLSWLDAQQEWKDLKALIEVRSARTVRGKTTEEYRYYISSKNMNAEQASQVIRSHWSVESYHWVLDVLFGDDSVGHAAENLGLFRRMAYCLLKQETVNGRGMASLQRKAMWDEDYMLDLLGNFIKKASETIT